MAKLTLIRHGQSLWNAQNRFTGWVDVPLSRQGIDEALAAGELLANDKFDAAFTSTLMRAQETLMLLLSANRVSCSPVIIHPEIGSDWFMHMEQQVIDSMLPIYYDQRLNERYYGDLQGKDKDETSHKYGADQVKIWRRSFNICPPNGESLELTCARTLPCFKERILPMLESGKNVIISAHGNSLRSIIMDLEGIGQEDIVSLEIATGKPLQYSFVAGTFIKISE
jgi:2,3-bisphosphoglycerate-dependent phosphoglycerate mutase